MISSSVPSCYRGFRQFTLAALLLLILIFLPGRASAGQTPALSLQGFSGILNSPTAHVQAEGSLNALYSNQRDRFEQGTPSNQDNYLFSVGFFNSVEIGGRLTDTSGDLNICDLSANAKLSSAPFTGKFPYAPAIALGIQDIGGGATFLQTTYLAASVDPLPWLRLSGGYGFGPDRMEGGFGGVELQVHEWLTLLGEYDSRTINAGLRLTTPPLPYFPVRFTITGSVPLSRSGDLVVAAGFSLPLDFKSHVTGEKKVVPATQVPAPASPPETAAATTPEPPTPYLRVTNWPHADASSALSSVRARLVAAGFVNVRVGILKGTVLVVEYENIRYNHNELDALGVVAGIATAGAPTAIETVWLVVKRKDIRVLRLSAPLKELHDWLSGNVATPPAIQVDNDPGSRKGIGFTSGDGNPGWLRPSLMLYPGLITYVGTEAGAFDYVLSIKPDLGVPLWRGGLLSARWDLPVAWSDSFDDGKIFASSRHDARMDRLMLFQGISLLPGLMANLGVGMIQHDTYGTLNELNWSPGSGRHNFRLIQAWAHDDDADKDINVWLASYRLYIAPLDLFLVGTGGRFWDQDTGGMLEMKRFFGDTAVSLYYKNSVTATDDKRWQAAGIQFSFPLSFRRDMKAAPVQIRGTDEWSYFQESILAVNGQKTNNVNVSLGNIPQTSGSLQRVYLNRDRMNADYINAHLERLKDAWQIFRDDR